MLILLIVFCIGLAVAIIAGAVLVFITLRRSWSHIRSDLAHADAKLMPCTHCGYDLRARSDICPECGQKTWLRQRRPGPII